MKISLDWLRDYVDYTEGPDRLAVLLTRIGFPVEDCRPVGADWMLDVEITSNRPDCLAHVGIAREVAAATGAQVKLPDVALPESDADVNALTSVVDEEPRWCARYTARVIENVTVAPSPDWMVRRLETIGQRGINNVVDITNYVLMEIGQPLHTFDQAQLREGRIVVRRAQPGEQMELIDHSKITLDDQMLVIADAKRPVALAGVMGGLASEVSDDTKTVLLESAHFDPLCIRRTSRTLAAASESSYRFERDVDPVMLEWASRRAAGLLAQLAGGNVAKGLVDVWPRQDEQTRQPDIALRFSRLHKLLGIQLDPGHVVRLLAGLGLQPRIENDIVHCIAPSWRRDLTREVDLVEEVIRLHGYDAIPTEKRIHIHVAIPDATARTTRKVTRALAGCGYFETVNVSFVDDAAFQPFMPADFQPLRVKDQARRSSNALRPTLLPSLMAARKRNQDTGNSHCNFYEISATHRPAPTGLLPKETICLALLTDEDFQHLRGVVETVVASLDKNAAVTLEPAELCWTDQGRGATVRVDDKPIGDIGLANHAALEAFGLETPVCLAQLDFNALIEHEGREMKLKPLLRFPPIERDLSLIVEEAIPWATLRQVIHDQCVDDLQEIRFQELYRGKHIPAGKKGVMLTLEFRRPERTLTHEEVDTHQQKILHALAQHCHATLRT